MGDGIYEVCLAKPGAAVDEEGIVVRKPSAEPGFCATAIAA
jgi:hypothetical protein